LILSEADSNFKSGANMKKLATVVFLFFASLVYASEQMIEISVEVTEMYENKAGNLGMQLLDSINARRSLIFQPF
jgi:hypothetical protein